MLFDYSFEIYQISNRQKQSEKYAFVNMSIIFMPSRQSVGNDFDVAKLRIYLQSAKQIAAFFEIKGILPP